MSAGRTSGIPPTLVVTTSRPQLRKVVFVRWLVHAVFFVSWLSLGEWCRVKTDTTHLLRPSSLHNGHAESLRHRTVQKNLTLGEDGGHFLVRYSADDFHTVLQLMAFLRLLNLNAAGSVAADDDSQAWVEVADGMQRLGQQAGPLSNDQSASHDNDNLLCAVAAHNWIAPSQSLRAGSRHKHTADNSVGDDGSLVHSNTSPQHCVFSPRVGNTDDVAGITQSELQETIGDDTAEVAEAKQRMVRKHSRNTQRSRIKKSIMSERGEGRVAVHDVNLLAEKDVTHERKLRHDSRQSALVVKSGHG
eukprot:m.94160 g.94160  ORF g.94160 m.94160 type:complete len:303 (-) comp18361_c0_seq4:225-1133(-)